MGREISNEARMSDRVIADLKFLLGELKPLTLCRREAEMYLKTKVEEYLN